MNEQTINETDFELMDDLPLSERIEWSHFQTELVSINKSAHDRGDWFAA